MNVAKPLRISFLEYITLVAAFAFMIYLMSKTRLDYNSVVLLAFTGHSCDFCNEKQVNKIRCT